MELNTYLFVKCFSYVNSRIYYNCKNRFTKKVPNLKFDRSVVHLQEGNVVLIREFVEVLVGHHFPVKRQQLVVKNSYWMPIFNVLSHYKKAPKRSWKKCKIVAFTGCKQKSRFRGV
jgi:hypothetical protein